jgi:hypothetical protein
MPQLLSGVCANPGDITVSGDALKDVPEMSIIVAQLIGHWSRIDQELGLVLVRMLGAKDVPALAMYSALNRDRTRRDALNAAAKAVLNAADYNVFAAVFSAARTVEKTRNRLAHWAWGTCTALPRALLLVDPANLVDVAKFHIQARDDRSYWLSMPFEELVKKGSFDADRIYVYRLSDLERELADMNEVGMIMFWYMQYLRPIFTEESISTTTEAALRAGQPPPSYERGTSAEALRELSSLRLFREALARIESRSGQSSPQSPSGSPPPAGGA